MRREGRRPVAARRRPESSGLFHTFPPNGNDNTRVIPARISRAIRPASRPAFLNRSFQTCLRQAGAALPPVSIQAWIPAFAGMTFLPESALRLSASSLSLFIHWRTGHVQRRIDSFKTAAFDPIFTDGRW